MKSGQVPHNHPTLAGQSFSFEDIPKEMSERIYLLYDQNYTHGTAYKEIIKSLKCECVSPLEFHQNLAHRSKIPRRSDFNQLYTQYKIDKYGSKDLDTMFGMLDKKVKNLLKKEKDYSSQYHQPFNVEENSGKFTLHPGTGYPVDAHFMHIWTYFPHFSPKIIKILYFGLFIKR